LSSGTCLQSSGFQSASHSPATFATSPAAHTFGTEERKRESTVTAPLGASASPVLAKNSEFGTTPSAAATSSQGTLRPEAT